MTNREKYAEEILDLACIREDIAFDKRTMEVIGCNSLDCADCLFNVIDKSCSERLVEWVESEYVEPVKISKKDRVFLDYLDKEFKYIARDKNGILMAYEHAGEKYEDEWMLSCGSVKSFFKLNVQFPMIQWSDSEPWKVEDLKKLEVVDEY